MTTPLLPLGAAVPLKSNSLCYGPWITTYSYGPASKTSYERNTTFNPWNFGANYILNYAAQILVETQVTQQVVSEAGGLTIPGIPPGRLGSTLIAGGPEITNVDVQVGRDGITSSIRMRTWVPNFGELGKRNVDVLAKAGTYYRGLQRAFNLNRITPGIGGPAGNFIRMLTRSDRFNRNSSHSVIAAEYIEDPSHADLKRVNVVITDVRKLLPTVKGDYEQKAFMGLEGLFRPYATYDNDVGLPAFKTTDFAEDAPATMETLNPFSDDGGDGHPIEIISRGTYEQITDFNIRKETSGYPAISDYRGVGLATPLILVGWGLDTNGKPVPNENPEEPTDNFIENHKKKPELWKAGALDARWNESLGLWQAGGNPILMARLTTTLAQGGSATATVYERDADTGTFVPTSTVHTVYDYLLTNGSVVSSNTKVFITQINGLWFVLIPACITGI